MPDGGPDRLPPFPASPPRHFCVPARWGGGRGPRQSRLPAAAPVDGRLAHALARRERLSGDGAGRRVPTGGIRAVRRHVLAALSSAREQGASGRAVGLSVEHPAFATSSAGGAAEVPTTHLVQDRRRIQYRPRTEPPVVAHGTRTRTPPRLRRTRFPLGHGHLHGDAYPGNTLWDERDVRLGDWDEAAVGPREIDLANTFQGVRFGRTSAELDDFSSQYGYDLRRWPGLQVLCGIRDLHTLGSFIRRADRGDTAAAEQLSYRIETLRSTDTRARWGAA
ncbi:phosphotransferase [Streptomyces sp. LBUM 1476]|nr:phosphotransferase [Streptomyces sp. LBUM 1476]